MKESQFQHNITACDYWTDQALTFPLVWLFHWVSLNSHPSYNQCQCRLILGCSGSFRLLPPETTPARIQILQRIPNETWPDLFQQREFIHKVNYGLPGCTYVAFTWNQADGGRHLVNGTGKNKQSNRMEGRQNKTPMMTCCYGDVVLFTKNGIKYI